MKSFYLALTILFHPIDTFRMIQRDRSRFNYFPPLAILAIVLVARIFDVRFTHFTLASINPWDTTIWLEMIKFALPIVSFIIIQYAVTTIIDGESMFREVVLAISLSLMPYIVCTPLISCFSRVLCAEEKVFYVLLNIGVWIWVGLLLYNSIRVMNNYTVGQTMGIIFITIVGMAIFWAICVLIYSLGNQLLEFIASFAVEIKMKLLH